MVEIKVLEIYVVWMNIQLKRMLKKDTATYAQHEDYLLILEDRNVVDLEDIFILYYKNQNKPHRNSI